MTIPRWIVLCAACIIGGIGIGLLIPMLWEDEPQQAVIAPPANDFAGTKTETKACKTVEALPEKAKEKLGLPDAVKKDDRVSVIATADTPTDGRPYIASALLNRDTGVGQIAFTPQPLPWLSRQTRYEIGLAYGIGNDGTVTRIDGTTDLLQIKSIHFGLTGTVDTDGRWFGGGRVWISF